MGDKGYKESDIPFIFTLSRFRLDKHAQIRRSFVNGVVGLAFEVRIDDNDHLCALSESFGGT